VKISGAPGYAYGFAVFVALAAVALLLLFFLNRYRVPEPAAGR
jgi:hypothetical protein